MLHIGDSVRLRTKGIKLFNNFYNRTDALYKIGVVYHIDDRKKDNIMLMFHDETKEFWISEEYIFKVNIDKLLELAEKGLRDES